MSALKRWKSQEVASYSPAHQFSFCLFFYLCSRQCLLITMIIIAIHPHLAAFFIVSVEKTVQEWFSYINI